MSGLGVNYRGSVGGALALVLLTVLAGVQSGDATVAKEVCGLINNYDLKNLTETPYWTIPAEGYCAWENSTDCYLYVSFCHPITALVDFTTPDISAVFMSSDGHKNIIGRYNNTQQFIADAESPAVYIGYRNGDSIPTCRVPQSVLIVLSCATTVPWKPNKTTGTPAPAKSKPKISIALDPGACSYLVNVEYSGACYIPDHVIPYHPTKLSAGTLIIIVCIVIIVCYLSFGMILNKLDGAHGVELVPNYSFWVLLPSYVSGGFVFVFKKLTCADNATGQTKSYEEL